MAEHQHVKALCSCTCPSVVARDPECNTACTCPATRTTDDGRTQRFYACGCCEEWRGTQSCTPADSMVYGYILYLCAPHLEERQKAWEKFLAAIRREGDD